MSSPVPPPPSPESRLDAARPASMASLADTLLSSSFESSQSREIYSRPTSYAASASASDASSGQTKALPRLHRQTSTAIPSITGEHARPRHILMRSRRISMPVIPSSGAGLADNTPIRRQLLQSSVPMPNKNRLSTASARSCESLPEEDESSAMEQAAIIAVGGVPSSSRSSLEVIPPNGAASSSKGGVPKPERRIRVKSSVPSRRSSMSPSGLGRSTSTSPFPGPGDGRPVSMMALPATSPLVATSVIYSQSPENYAYQVGSTRERQQPPTPVIKQPATNQQNQRQANVRFSAVFESTPGTRSIISKAAYNTAKRTARSAKRDRISNELLETERVYVGVLNDVHEHFLSPLLASSTSVDSARPAIFSPRTIKEVFSNFQDIRTLAQEVLRRLEGSVGASPIPIADPTSPPSAFAVFGNPISSTSSAAPIHATLARTYRGAAMLAVPRNIAETLAPVLPFLKCYALFVRNFAAAQTRLEKEDRGNEAWKAFVAEKRSNGVGGRLNLAAMLLCIVQRIPRYRLLLNDLLRYTNADDFDYKPLLEARKIVEEVASHLESSIKTHESSLQMLDLQRNLHGLDFPLITPGRRLLKAGVLVKQGRRAEEERAFFLFSDLLIYADVQYPYSAAGAAWSRAVSVTNLAGLADPAHEHQHGPASASHASDKGRLSVVWPNSAPSPSAISVAHGGGAILQGNQYTFKRKIELDDLTVNGAEGTSFEIRSSVKSFSVIAATVQVKYEWMSALREAKDELLNSRRTLLKDEGDKLRHRIRRLSMPVAPLRSPSMPFLATSAGQQQLEAKVSAIPVKQGPSPAKIKAPLPMVLPVDARDADDDFEDPSPAPGLTYSSSEPSPPSAEELSPTAPNIVLNTPSTPASTLGSGSDYFSASNGGSPAKIGGLKVYEDYSAPVWVPDHRADRCMRCNEAFAVWRRRHHCRLCGDVVCWACSLKNFAIPSADPGAPPRVGRACDDCYTTCFEGTPIDELEDPLASSLPSIPQTPSILPNNPLPPLLRRAASSALDAVRVVHSRDTSLDKDSGAPGAKTGQTTPRKTRESVELLRSVLMR